MIANLSIESDVYSMDGTLLFASFFFGLVGMAFFAFGKRAGRMVPLGSGLGLMIVPYFLPGLGSMVVVSSILTVVPFVIRE